MTCRLVVVGAGDVGKSAFVLQCCNGIFIEQHYDATVSDSYRKIIKIDDEDIRVDFFDLSLQTEYASVKNSLYLQCDAALIIYSVTDYDSFEEVSKIVLDLKTVRNDGGYEDTIPFVIFANKCDLAEQRKVITDDAKELEKSLGISVVEGSCRQNALVNDTVRRLVSIVASKQRARREQDMMNNNLHQRRKPKRRCIIV